MLLNDSPLVSIVVLSYNSSATILDTLESVKAQTYPNLELVISDDCSSDDTVGICRDWINSNPGRFARAIVIDSCVNKGISANLNRAQKELTGEWVKGVAGDDMLLPNCVEDNLHFCIDNGFSAVASRLVPFGPGKDRWRSPLDYDGFYGMSAEKQYEYLMIHGCIIPAPTVFYNRQAVVSRNLSYDESIPMIDDWPFWLKMTSSGIAFRYMDKDTVMYRISDNSLSNSPSLSTGFLKSLASVYLNYCFKYRIRHLSKRVEIKNWLNAKVLVTGKQFYSSLLAGYSNMDNVLSRLFGKEPAPVKFGLDSR